MNFSSSPHFPAYFPASRGLRGLKDCSVGSASHLFPLYKVIAVSWFSAINASRAQLSLNHPSILAVLIYPSRASSPRLSCHRPYWHRPPPRRHAWFKSFPPRPLRPDWPCPKNTTRPVARSPKQRTWPTVSANRCCHCGTPTL